MIEYPAFILACPATMALILRALAGQLPCEDYYAAWDALADPDGYEPSEQVRLWMHENWHALMHGTEAAGQETTPEPPAIDPPVLARKWMEPFLVEYAKSKNITKAAEAAPISRETVHCYLRHDPEFARAFEQAFESYRDRVRKKFNRRALDGWDEPIFGTLPGKGAGNGIIGYVRKYDPRAFMRLVEKECPEYASTREGTTVNVSANATASADARAGIVIATPEKLADLQNRTRHKLQNRVERARLALVSPAAVGPAETATPATTASTK